MSDRILGAVCIAVGAGMAWAAQDYAATISYEPVGPRAFPLLLAALMAASGLWLVLRPSLGAVNFRSVPWTATVLSAVAICLYALLFQTLGFTLATVLMAVPVGMAFGGNWKQAVASGAGLGIVLYFMFDKLLDVVLPTGILSFLLGGR